MATPTAALLVSTKGADEAWAASVAAPAVRRAKRASDDDVYGKGPSTQQPPVDFMSLGLTGLWNCKGAHIRFRLADGQVVFTCGRDVAHRATVHGAERCAAGSSGNSRAASAEHSVVHGVLSASPPWTAISNKGAVAYNLWAEGVPAVYSCLWRDSPPHEAMQLALVGHELWQLQLDKALKLLYLALAAEVAGSKARASGVDYVWLLGGQRGQAKWQRLATLRGLGVHVGDDRALAVGRITDFFAGAADARPTRTTPLSRCTLLFAHCSTGGGAGR
eukprot:1812645-Pleurochrysis_carterae.AAC.2